MISIDNAVELMIKTYLALPKRVTGIEGLTRKKFSEISHTFPSLLDGLEEFAADRIVGVELGDIEWYHRLRNQLYHDGNGVTVGKPRVEAYAEIAKALFSALFRVPIEESFDEEPLDLLGSFIRLWVELEHALIGLRNQTGITSSSAPYAVIEALADAGSLPASFVAEFQELRRLRNEIVHSASTPNVEDLTERIQKLKRLLSVVREWYQISAVKGSTEAADWKGAAWEGRFLCYDGPVEALRLIEDRPFEQAMADALAAAGFRAGLAVLHKLRDKVKKGTRVIHLTDKKSWRQKITMKELILVATPGD
jgi:hypothetical protein